jgi:aldose 1-epimerase
VTRTLHLHHASGLALSLSTFGAAWLSCQVPLADGSRRHVILQRPALPDAATRRAYVGTTIGRYANRIGRARIARGSQAWPLQPNPGSRHQLHGGPEGFDQREWTVLHADATSARLALLSPDGDQGYPGALQAEVTYRLTDAAIEMEAVATTSADCPVCLTNHAYFNLDGGIGSASDVRQHRLRIAADLFLPVDAELIPHGSLAGVAGTSFDFRAGKPIETHWLQDEQQRQAGGYDHAFLLHGACAGMAEPAAQLASSDGALRMSVSTTLPALQFYAGQMLDGVAAPGGTPYPRCAALALEPQFLPDSPNHPEWPQPSCWLAPGEVYRHLIRYAFSG